MTELTAREYLEQMKAIDVRIQQDLERLEELKHSATGQRAITYDSDKVQVSPSDRLGAAVARYVDLDERINREIDKFVDAKNRVIEQIQGLKDPDHIQILFKVYVQYKTLKEAAPEVGYSYGAVLLKHSDALTAFQEKYAPLGYLCS